MRITKAALANMTEGTKPRTIFDDELAGFGVRVFPSGRKTFILEYRPAGAGRTATKRRLSFGSVNEIPLDRARKAAKDQLARIRLGSDPMAERAEEKKDQSVSLIVEAFLQDADRRLKKRTASEYRRILETHLLPGHRNRKFKEMSRSDVARLHSKLSAQAPVQANRLIATFSTCWNWAAKRELAGLPDNPCRGLEKNRETAKERFLNDTELAKLGRSLRLAETSGLPWNNIKSHGSRNLVKEGSRFTKFLQGVTDTIRLLILTGARLRELLHIKWEEIDFQRGIAFLSDSKTGRKPLMLSESALRILSDTSRIEGCLYVFPGQGLQPRSDLKRPWAAITKHAGLENVRLHDLRHSSASIMAGAGASLQIIGRVLGHSQFATTARYSHLSADPVKLAVDRLGDHVMAALNYSDHSI